MESTRNAPFRRFNPYVCRAPHKHARPPDFLVYKKKLPPFWLILIPCKICSLSTLVEFVTAYWVKVVFPDFSKIDYLAIFHFVMFFFFRLRGVKTILTNLPVWKFHGLKCLVSICCHWKEALRKEGVWSWKLKWFLLYRIRI